jgi:DHA1 family bicyclomycin/chloramphenicol resistance-like MFS transporter
MPATSVLALEDHGAIAGTASALIGTIQFVTGALLMVFVGTFQNGTALPMVAGIAACAAISMVFAQMSVHSREPEAEAEPATD